MKLFKRLEYEVLGSTPIRNVLKTYENTSRSAYQKRVIVIDYLQRVKVEGMRKHLCFSCKFVSLYDKNNKRYKVSRTDTIEQVKAIVDEIRKINQSE